MKTLIKKLLTRLGFNFKEKADFFQLRFNKGNIAKLFYFKKMFDSVSNVDGDVVECGIGKATSAQILALLINNENKGRKFWGFDSFEGFPDPTSEDISFRNPKRGEWKKMSRDDMYEVLSNCRLGKDFIDSKIKIAKGFFSETLPNCNVGNIALLHLDVDLYKSYRDCLEYLFPRVTRGGGGIV